MHKMLLSKIRSWSKFQNICKTANIIYRKEIFVRKSKIRISSLCLSQPLKLFHAYLFIFSLQKYRNTPLLVVPFSNVNNFVLKKLIAKVKTVLKFSSSPLLYPVLYKIITLWNQKFYGLENWRILRYYNECALVSYL